MIELDDLSYLDGQRILITGGTGSLGRKLTKIILERSRARAVVIYSRDEYKQFLMAQQFDDSARARLRFFLGDVRDADRLRRAFESVSYVIHTAALKQVPAAEYNPFEFVKTNIHGAENVINAALDTGVRHVIALSTDKAANPINLYGATKLCSDKLFIAGNSYSGVKETRFAVVRYGNVIGSRGSVVPFFLEQRRLGELPITDERMTRFWITLEQGAALVLNALREMRGGEVFVPRIPSMRIIDLARVIAPECRTRIVGIRPGEKLHEVMIPVDEGRSTLQFDRHFVILPQVRRDGGLATRESYLACGGVPCPDGFYYGSDNNDLWLDDRELARMVADLDLPEAKVWAAERGLT